MRKGSSVWVVCSVVNRSVSNGVNRDVNQAGRRKGHDSRGGQMIRFKAGVDDVIEKGSKKVFRIVASTSDVDRDGEVILPTAWTKSLPRYLKNNPVVLWGHDQNIPPVGKAVGGEITSKSLNLDIVFADTDLGKELEKLYEEDFLTSFSVGFQPKKWTKQNGTRVWTEADLLEVSCVSIPANEGARVIRDAKDFLMPVVHAKGLLLGDSDPDEYMKAVERAIREAKQREALYEEIEELEKELKELDVLERRIRMENRVTPGCLIVND